MKLIKIIRKVIVMLLCASMVITNAIPSLAAEEIEEENISSPSEIIDEETEEINDIMEEPEEESEEEVEEATPSDVEEIDEIEEIGEASPSEIEMPMLLGAPLFGDPAPTDDCKIGIQGYATLQDGIDAVNNGETIIINKSEICYATPITINNGKTFTIDFMDGSSQRQFRWFDMMGSQTDKDVFTISNGSNVTIKNMKYLVGLGEQNNRVFKVESTGTLTLNNFNSLTSDNVQDVIVYNNGGTVNINNGHIESIREKLFTQNGGTFNIGGSSLICKINNTSYSIFCIGDGNTDVNYDAGTVNINDGDFQVAQLLKINAKAKININKANSSLSEGMGYILITEYGKKSNININDYTAETYGDPFIIIRNIVMDTKIVINGGKYKYGQSVFCKDESSSSPLFEASLKGGLFGPDSGATTDAYNELSNLLASGCTLEEIPSTDPEYSNGYFYRVKSPTPPPTPTPSHSGSSSGSGGGGGSPRYDLAGNILGPSGIQSYTYDGSNPPVLTSKINTAHWDYNTGTSQIADIHYVQNTDSFMKSDNTPVATEWVGVSMENSSKLVWYRTDASGKILRNQFIQIGNNIYYLDNNGIMVTGKHTIDGKVYNFDTTVGGTEGKLLY